MAQADRASAGWQADEEEVKVSPVPKTLRDHVRDFERNLVAQTLQRNNGDRRKTAEALGVSERGLEKILNRHHMLRRRFTRPLPIMPPATKKNQEKT